MPPNTQSIPYCAVTAKNAFGEFGKTSPSRHVLDGAPSVNSSFQSCFSNTAGSNEEIPPKTYRVVPIMAAPAPAKGLGRSGSALDFTAPVPSTLKIETVATDFPPKRPPATINRSSQGAEADQLGTFTWDSFHDFASPASEERGQVQTESAPSPRAAAEGAATRRAFPAFPTNPPGIICDSPGIPADFNSIF